MSERNIPGRESRPTLPLVYKKVTLFNEARWEREPVALRSAISDRSGIRYGVGDGVGISSFVHASFSNSLRFDSLRPEAREMYSASATPEMICQTIEHPDTLLAAVATDSTYRPVGYVVTRYARHKFPKPYYGDHNAAELVSLHTSPDFPRLGKRLLQLAAQQARAAGIPRMVTEAYKGDVPWLIDEGFVQSGGGRGFSADPELAKDGLYVPTVYMEKSLGFPKNTGVIEPKQGLAAIRFRHGQDTLAGMAELPFLYDLRDAKEWRGQGDKENPNRQLFLRHLQPHFLDVQGKDVLDVGGGLGWLSDVVRQKGGKPVCLEPSSQLIDDGQTAHPYVNFANSTLKAFETDKQFDTAFAIMVDNFINLESALQKVSHLLKPGGKFVTIISDFERTVKGRDEYDVAVELLRETDEAAYERFENDFFSELLRQGEAAVNIHYPGKYGDIYVIPRTVDRYKEFAQMAGLRFRNHTKIFAEEGHPHYGKIDTPLFHMLEFSA